MTDDYYNFHQDHMILVGERTSKIYRIGDEVEITVNRVNMSDHTIDFVFAGTKGNSDRYSGRAGRNRQDVGQAGDRKPARGGKPGTAAGGSSNDRRKPRAGGDRNPRQGDKRSGATDSRDNKGKKDFKRGPRTSAVTGDKSKNPGWKTTA